MTRFAVVVIILTLCLQAQAQRKAAGMQIIKTPAATVCYASGKNEFTTVGPPAGYLRNKAYQASARTQSTQIEVDYEGFTQQAQDAFQEAVDIWESILQSSVKIRIRARWTPLEAGVLGSAGPAQYVYNFDGAPKNGVWYPIALAEKITGEEINDASEYDIEAAFNSANAAWHFGLSGSNPPAGKYDLVSIVLHEIGHGLGISHGYDISNGQAVVPSYFEGKPVVYETDIETGAGKNYVNDFKLPSASLKTEITSNTLFLSSALVRNVNSGDDGSLYAPTTYTSGSSIAHLDENTYPAGTINSLMTPQIGAAERILDPGPITEGILKEIGWTSTVLQHMALKDTETAGPYHAVVKIRSDVGYNHSSVTLVYSTTTITDATVPMTTTGNADEWAVNIPAGHSNYSYYIRVAANDGRTAVTPAIQVTPGSQPLQGRFQFHAGPDTKAPVIVHQKKEFATNIDDFIVAAEVTDNIGIDNVTLKWRLNGVSKPDKLMPFLAGTTSTYETIIDKSNFSIGDTIEYRIRAEDSSVAGNLAYDPSSTGFNLVVVTGLGATQDSYLNNFNNLSNKDFFGTGFSVTSDASFDGHINSTSPYPAGGSADAHVDLIYNLKIPIRVASKDATVRFDEIVLVEPGEDGSVWPNDNFYDYVVVEGSTDGGVTWTAIADGYDCRYNADWLTVWNSSSDGDNSTGVGNPGLYRNHQFNLLDKFHAGNEVAIRFRLFSDPFSFGWGWAIDNLKIQIDDIPPSIKHQQCDFLIDGTNSLVLDMKIDDIHGLQDLFIDYNVNGGTVATNEILVNPAIDLYSATIDLSSLGLKDGDEFQYRIRAIDSVGNAGSFPSDGFIKTAIISLTSSIGGFETDFDTQSPDITANFFDEADSKMNSRQPYDLGMGIDGNSDFSWMTKKAIEVDDNNPWIYYEDIAIVEYDGLSVKDYVVVEASKDGASWEQLISPYAANAVDEWKAAFDAGGEPDASVPFATHRLNITAGGKFKAGDIVLVRFRLHSDSVKSGWGWMVDKLSIQGETTGVEPQVATNVHAWPNPVVGNSLYLKMTLAESSDVSVEILNTQGQLVSTDRFSAPSGDFQRAYEVSNWANGLYLVRVKSSSGTFVTRLVKSR